MEQRLLWILLGKRLSGHISADEQATLEKLIKSGGKDISFLIEFLEDQWKKDIRKPVEDGSHAEAQWDLLAARLRETPETMTPSKILSRRKRRIGRWYKIAACVAILVAAGIFLLKRQATQGVYGMHEIAVGNGERKYLTLPDGTEVWLNAGSRLSYQGTLLNKRDVRLEGEAFFKVISDASTPFTVRAKNITVKVLGTNFNVKAYRDDSDIQTTLISGKIQVLLNNDPEKKVLLSPHEKLTVVSAGRRTVASTSTHQDMPGSTESVPVIPQANRLSYQVQTLPLNPADTTYFTETAWVRNELAFAGQPFSEVAKEMERRYNVKIIFEQQGLKQVKMSGVFDKESIQEALDVLRLITRFRYRIENDAIYLYK